MEPVSIFYSQTFATAAWQGQLADTPFFISSGKQPLSKAAGKEYTCTSF